jgi:V/A-type H+-transporting ATPase subunit E
LQTSDYSKLVNKILEEARREAEVTLEQARKTAESIIEEKRLEAKRRAEDEARSIISKAEENARRIIEGAVANARIKANWAKLSEKQRILDEVFTSTKRRIAEFRQTETYRMLLESLITEGATATGGGRLDIILGADDISTRIDLTRIEQEVEKRTGKKTILSINNQAATIAGGAIIRSVDGKVTVDSSIDSIIERKRRTLEPQVAKMLFE